MANAWVPFSTFTVHSNSGTFEFLNDTGVDLFAGYSFVLDDGTDKHVATLIRDCPDGEVGALHFTQPRNIYMAPYATAANVAVGALMSIEAASGNMIAGVSEQGRFIALPKQAGTMTGAAAAAASGDTAVLVADVGTT